MEKLNYIHTPPKEPYEYITINQSLKICVAENPNTELYVHRFIDGSRKSLTSRDLMTKATIVAKHLVANGINKGDRVAVLGPNTLEWIICEYGILLCGAVSVHLAVTTKNAEDAFEMIKASQCQSIFINVGHDDHLVAMVSKLSTANGDEDMIIEKKRIVLLDKTSVAEYHQYSVVQDILRENKNADIVLPVVFPEDIAVIFTTSGSTGKPKMVAHRHTSFTKCREFKATEHTTKFNERPFGWAGGSVLKNVIDRVSRVFVDSSISQDKTNLEFIWNLIWEEKCDFVLFLPHVLKDVLEMRKNNELKGYILKAILTGGQIVDKMFRESIGVLCEELWIGYGSTEDFGIAVKKITSRDEVILTGEVGRPSEGVELRIVDEQGFPTVYGLMGSIQVKTASMFAEYINDPEATKAVFTMDGWFKTGDVGKLTDDGTVLILGREKDVISRGTRKIIPGFIEDIIKQLTSVVQRVVVIGVPDKRLFEEVCVCFESVDDSEESVKCLESFCNDILSDAQDSVDGLGIMPKYFLQFDKLPRLATGKVDKVALKSEAITLLSLGNNI